MLKQVVHYYTQKTNYGCVAIKKVKDLACDCEKINSLARTNNVSLVVFCPVWTINTAEMIFYAYGCPLLEKEMPQTLLQVHERRTWVFLDEKTKQRKNILFYGLPLHDEQWVKIKKHAKIITGNPDIAVFTNNTLRLDSLFKQIGFNYGR